MWLSRIWPAGARMLLAVCCLSLPACGFKPLYGNNAAGASETAVSSGVEIANIPDREGLRLRNLLIDRMYLKGRPADAPYLLTVTPLKTALTNLGIRKDATSTRAMLQVSATVRLTDRATNAVVLEREVRSVGGYNQLDNQFATLVSRESVSDHMLEEMSDSIVTEVALYFTRNHQPSRNETP